MKFALVLHSLSIMFLLLLSDETQRQAERLGKDVRLPSVHWEQGEVDQLLPLVNTEDRNRNSLRLKITTDRQSGLLICANQMCSGKEQIQLAVNTSVYHSVCQ